MYTVVFDCRVCIPAHVEVEIMGGAARRGDISRSFREWLALGSAPLYAYTNVM